LLFHQSFVDDVVLLAEPNREILSGIKPWRLLFDFELKVYPAVLTGVEFSKAMDEIVHLLFHQLRRFVGVA